MKKYLFLFLFFIAIKSDYSQSHFALREEVQKYLAQSNSNFNFAMIAEAYRNDIRIAFFWPCMLDSNLVDNKIIALAFEKQLNTWETVDMFIASKDTGMAKFIQIIGGHDYNVVKPDGVPLQNIGYFMYNEIMNIHKAIAKKDNEKAISEIEEFSKAFGLRTCVFNNIMSDYIMRGAKILDVSEIKISDVVTVNDTGSATLDVYFPKGAKSNNVKLIRIGTGWAIDDVQNK